MRKAVIISLRAVKIEKILIYYELIKQENS
jgi:hypothetical protein